MNLKPGESPTTSDRTRRAYSPTNYRRALEAAIVRVEKSAEFHAQHGPVRVLFKDGKPVEQA